MKKILLFTIALMLGSFVVMAQKVQSVKSTFIPKSGTIFNLNSNLALNTKSGQTLVVWERVNGSDHSIWGRTLNAQGKPPVGEFLLVSGPNASHPMVTYNPVKNVFVLTYDDNPNFNLIQSNIYLQPLNALGKIAGPVLKVTTDSVSSTLVNYLPRIVFAPKTSNYVLLWIREIMNPTQAQGSNGLVGVVVTPAVTLGGSIVVIRPTIPENPNLLEPIPLDATIQPVTGRLIIGYVQSVPGSNLTEFNYFYGNVDPKLGGITDANFSRINTSALNNAGFVWGMKLAFQSTGTGLVVYADTANVKRRKIDATGKLASPAATIFHPPKNNKQLLYPGLVFTNGAVGVRGLLLAIQDALSASGLATVWAQPLDQNGLPLGPPIKVDSLDSANTAFGTQLVALPQPPAATTYRFADIYTLTQFTSPGQTFQTSGLNLLNFSVTFP